MVDANTHDLNKHIQMQVLFNTLVSFFILGLEGMDLVEHRL